LSDEDETQVGVTLFDEIRKLAQAKALAFRTATGKVAVEPKAGKTYEQVLSEALIAADQQ